MKKIINKKYLYLVAILIVVLCVISVALYVKNQNNIGGYYNLQSNSSVVTTTFASLITSQVVYGDASGNAGQTVNLTWRIASSSLGIGNNFPSSSLHITNSTVTTTVIVGSANSGNNKAIQCFWNGTNFTKLSFPANSTTPTYTTSTSC